MSKIYLDAAGNYRDDTEENREAYPPAETTSELAAEALPEGERVPFTDDGAVDTDQIVDDPLAAQSGEVQTEGSGTVVESGSDVTPVAAEPDTAKARTRKQ